MVEDSRTPAELHEAGEAHSTEGCWPCLAVSLSQLGQRIREALADLAEALATAFDEDGRPRQVQHGPLPRRHRAPRDHRSNTGLAARSRNSTMSQRNALRRL